jgi:hypothetical protein
MRKLLALTPLFLIATTLPAQTPSNVILRSSPSSQNCPIGVTAQHTPQGGMQEVSPSAKHHQLGFDISLNAIDGRLIRQAKITLHGTTGGFLPAASRKNNADVTESFTLTPGDSPKPSFQSIVYAEKLTGVQWIEVDEVTYTDGTEWNQTAGSVCRVAPNGVILINATSKSLDPNP